MGNNTRYVLAFGASPGGTVAVSARPRLAKHAAQSTADATTTAEPAWRLGASWLVANVSRRTLVNNESSSPRMAPEARLEYAKGRRRAADAATARAARNASARKRRIWRPQIKLIRSTTTAQAVVALG